MDVRRGRQRHVLRVRSRRADVAGDKDALPGTENGAAKVTPLEMYPTKGRATGGVRSQRFLKGQNTLIFAWVGLYRCTPLHPQALRSSFPSPICAETVPE